jgi:prepilin-type processing-associated H-X9-DG protein
MKASPNTRLRRGFTLIEVMSIIAIIVLLVTLLLPAVQSAREAARRAQCVNNLKSLALAVVNYEVKYGTYPMSMPLRHHTYGAGEASSGSLFVSLLPFCENIAIYNSINIDYNMYNAPNFTVSGMGFSLLWCPSDGTISRRETLPQGAMLDPGEASMCYSSYAGNAGPFFPWKGDDSGGVFLRDRPIGISSITDGTSNTFLFGEHNHSLLEVDTALWWHWWTSGNNGDTLFCTLFGLDPHKRIASRGDALGVAYLSSASSLHPGGCNFAFADGSVKFIKDTIDSWSTDLATGLPTGIKIRPDGSVTFIPGVTSPGVYQKLSTRNGGELIGGDSY